MITTDEMVKKLNELYDKEEAMKKELKKLMNAYEDCLQDIELMELMFMHQSNRVGRRGNQDEKE